MNESINRIIWAFCRGVFTPKNTVVWKPLLMFTCFQCMVHPIRRIFHFGEIQIMLHIIIWVHFVSCWIIFDLIFWDDRLWNYKINSKLHTRLIFSVILWHYVSTKFYTSLSWRHKLFSFFLSFQVSKKYCKLI